MAINTSVRAEWADEISFDTATLVAGYNLMGELEHNPVIIIFDNQSDTTIEFSNNGTSTKKTFVAGEVFVLDMRANIGIASNFTFRKFMQLFLAGTAGTGDFKISYIYAVEAS